MALNIYDTMKPKGDFPVAEAADIIMPDGSRVSELKNGNMGSNGATFIPNVSSEGVISWTNDKNLDNPTPVNIKGPQGEKGEKGDKGDKGQDGAIISGELKKVDATFELQNPDETIDGTYTVNLVATPAGGDLCAFGNEETGFTIVLSATPNVDEIPDLKIGETYRITLSGGEVVSVEWVVKTKVDQTYNPESENAQSGKAVAEAIGSLNNQYELIMKVIVGYSILTSKPADWETNFAAYYKNTGTLREPVYTALTEFEEWESGKYYSYSNEETGISVIHTEPDGTEFCFKGIILDCQFTAASSSRNFYYAFRSASTGTNIKWVLYENTVPNGIKTSNSWYQCCCESMNSGIWTGVQNSNYTIQPIISRQIPRYEPMRALKFDNTLFPAGSTITIYGVRA